MHTEICDANMNRVAVNCWTVLAFHRRQPSILAVKGQHVAYSSAAMLGVALIACYRIHHYGVLG
jgi:hypothetical protein